MSRNVQYVQLVQVNLQNAQPAQVNLQNAQPAQVNLQNAQPAQVNLKNAQPAQVNLQIAQPARGKRIGFLTVLHLLTIDIHKRNNSGMKSQKENLICKLKMVPIVFNRPVGIK